MLLYQSQYILYMEKYKNSYNNKKFKVSAPTWNDKFEIPG